MKRLSPVVLVLLVVALLLLLLPAAAPIMLAALRNRSSTPTPTPHVATLPVISSGSGFSLGTTPPIVPLAADWKPVSLAQSDVRLSYPPSWNADTTSNPGALLLAPSPQGNSEPAREHQLRRTGQTHRYRQPAWAANGRRSPCRA